MKKDVDRSFRETLDVISSYQFFATACEVIVRNAKRALELAGEPVTRENIIAFVYRLPRYRNQLTTDLWKGGYCNHVLAKAHEATKGSDEFTAIADWCVGYFVERSVHAQDMLQDAVVGVVNGLGDSVIRNNVCKSSKSRATASRSQGLLTWFTS
jgi:hypothetical protein